MKTYIPTQDFMAVWPKYHGTNTDNYYVRLANRLYENIKFYQDNIYTTNALIEIAKNLTYYFEDVVGDIGLWRSFSSLCLEKYGFPVPMYHDEEEYYFDEPSSNAVRYLVWQTMSGIYSDRYVYPDSDKLTTMSASIYEFLDAEFEDAPVNDSCKEAVKHLIAHIGKGFNELRASLTWINAGNYITSGHWYEEDITEQFSNAIDKTDDKLTPDMLMFSLHTSFLFSYKCGPLALTAPEWMKALAEALGMEKEKALLEEMKILKPDTYKYTIDNDEWTSVESLHGDKFKVSVKELNTPLDLLRTTDGLIGQFIFYDGQWRMNGVMMPLKLDGKFEELKLDQPDIPKPGTKLLSVERILKATHGRRIFYFKDVYELSDTMRKLKLVPKDTKLVIPDIEDNKYPSLFIDDKDPVDNMFIGLGLELDICDPDNPYYDPEDAKEDSINMLHNTHATTNFVDWLINQDFLPDAAHSRLFIQSSTPEQLRGDMHFMVRTQRRNNV